MVAFVLSNFDENQQYLDLDNNQGLLQFEQRAMKLCMVLVWIVILIVSEGFGSNTVCFCFMML